MRNLILLIALALITSVAFGQSKDFKENTVKFGKGLGVKTILFDYSPDSDTPYISTDPATDKFTLFSSEIIIGKGTATDATITVDRGGLNPTIFWSEAEGTFLQTDINGVPKSLGGGSGVGSTSIFYSEQFEEEIWTTTGNNATPLGGGSIVGTLVKDETTQIAGTASQKYSNVTTNDYWCSDVIEVPERSEGVADVAFQFPYKYAGIDDEILVNLWDEVGATSLQTDFIKVGLNSIGYKISLGAVTQVRVCFQALATNAGSSLIADDLVIDDGNNTTKVFRGADIAVVNSTIATLDSETIKSDETTIQTDFLVLWDNAAKKIKSSLISGRDNMLSAVAFIGNFISFENYGAQQGDNYNATDSTLVGGASVNVVETTADDIVATLTMSGTTAGSLMALDAINNKHPIIGGSNGFVFKYAISGTTDDLIKCSIYDGATYLPGQIDVTLKATAGDPGRAKITFNWPATIVTGLQVKCEQLVTSTATFDFIQGQWTDDPLVTMDIKKDDQPYYITQAGNALTDRNLDVEFNLATATITGDNDELIKAIDNPGSTRTEFTAVKDHVAKVTVSGTNTSTGGRIDIYKNGVFYASGAQTYVATALTNAGAGIDMVAGDYLTFRAVGGDITNSAVPLTVSIVATPTGSSKGYVQSGDMPNNVVILKDVKPSGTAGGGVSAGVWTKRDLNTIEGNTSIASVSSSQFTLKAGTYDIDASAPAYLCNLHKIKLYNVTDASDALTGTSEIALEFNVTYNEQTRSFMTGTLTLTSTKTFELQHRCAVARATNGFGVPASFGDNEVYAQVKITQADLLPTTFVVPATIHSVVETEIGPYITAAGSQKIYRKCYELENATSGAVIDGTMTLAAVTPRDGFVKAGAGNWFKSLYAQSGTSTNSGYVTITATGLAYNFTAYDDANFCVEYTKNSENP